jgi:hypothetical protein
MKKIGPYAPTLARYALLVVGTKLASGGWLPPSVSNAMVNDPAVIEMATGLIVGASALVWFAYSKAKTAIKMISDFEF